MDLDTLLNENQKAAATYLDSHLRIIAGAGSGKTRVITYRIAYLIQQVGIDPRRILAITFTNKAANEMKERVQSLIQGSGFGTLVCTIHSLCVRILRQHINVIGYPSTFIIMDEEDQKSVIKKIYKELDVDAKSISVKSALHAISIYKCSHISPKRAIALAGQFEGELKKARVYEEYVKYQEKNFLLDFDDLLIKTVEIFENHPDVLQRWQHKFQYIHVDEFQDVGELEYRLVQLLSKVAITCVVGDPDQTIYSFRGANVNYILDFDKDYVPSHTIILDRNYRSTKKILDISNNLIRKNTNRLEKELYTTGQDGNDIVHYVGKSEQDEASYVASTIHSIIETTPGVNYNDFLILYRANYLSRNIEQVLIQNKMDYRIFGGLKFFNRKEIKDALSYLRLIAMDDDLAFERIINVPARGIGKKTIEKIELFALEHQLSMFQTISMHSDELRFSTKVKREIQEFVHAIQKARSSNETLLTIFENILEDVGYMEMLKKDIEENRIDNLQELKRGIYDYQQANIETATLENYLQDIALYTDNEVIDKGQYISMMSIHMSKGLEFNYVFVIGLSEGIFPSNRSLSEDGDDGLEEERRLAYVAFTRAKKQLFLTDSEGFSFVTDSPKISSRFVDEIGNQGVKKLGSKPRFKTSDYITTHVSKEQLIGNNQIDDWKAGDIVLHDIFGKGVCVGIKKGFIDVAFSHPHGVKTLLSTHQAIKKLMN